MTVIQKKEQFHVGTIAEVYYRLLAESGISLLNGTYITSESLLEQLAELGDPRISGSDERPNKVINFWGRLYSRLSNSMIIEINGHYKDPPCHYTTNPWYAIIPQSCFYPHKISLPKQTELKHVITPKFKEYQEFAIPELVNWQESLEEDNAEKQSSHNSIEDSVQTIIRGVQEAVNIFFSLPPGIRQRFMRAIKRAKLRRDLHYVSDDCVYAFHRERRERINHYAAARSIRDKMCDSVEGNKQKELRRMIRFICQEGKEYVSRHYMSSIDNQLWGLASFPLSAIPSEFREGRIDANVFERYRRDLRLRRAA